MMRKILAIWLILFAFSHYLQAQTTLELPSVIEEDLVLEPGNYVVKKNVYIKKDAKLIVNPGTNFLLGPDVSIIAGGNIVMNGAPKNFIFITSLDDKNPGNGLVFREFNEGTTQLNYVKFKQLKKPVHFQKNWYRDNISIQNCLFKDLKKNEISIEFQDIDQIQATKKIEVSLIGNTFSNNSGGILFANIASDYIKFNIVNNVVTRNEYTGRETNGLFSSPLFINYHDAPAANAPNIQGNSICYNFSSMIFRDTVEFYPVNITTIGSAESLNLSTNYFGEKSPEELSKMFDQISANQRAPFVYFNELMELPNGELNGHIYKIYVNGDPIGEDEPFKQWGEGIRDFTFHSNQPLSAGKDFKVAYHFLINDTMYIKHLEHESTLSNGDKTLTISLLDKVQKKLPNGYFVVDGLYDPKLFEIPSVTIGKRIFLNENREIFFKFRDLDEIPTKFTAKDFETNDTNVFKNLQNTNLPVDTNYFKFKPYYEFELFSGSSIYFGDLAADGLRVYPANARPAMGVRGGYHFKDRWKLELRSNYLILVGDDDVASTIGKSRGTGFKRKLNTRTTVVDFGLLMEYDLFKIAGPKYLIPSGFIGFQGYYFKPMGRYDGTYYDLRSIGTEGQTLNGADNRYSKFSVGIPLGIKLRKELSKTTSIAFSYTYTKLFTDYLDDLSTGFYPDSEALIAANPDLGESAAKVANPTNLKGQRSSSADYDGYAYYGLSVIFHFR